MTTDIASRLATVSSRFCLTAKWAASSAKQFRCCGKMTTAAPCFSSRSGLRPSLPKIKKSRSTLFPEVPPPEPEADNSPAPFEESCRVSHLCGFPIFSGYWFCPASLFWFRRIGPFPTRRGNVDGRPLVRRRFDGRRRLLGRRWWRRIWRFWRRIIWRWRRERELVRFATEGSKD